MLKDGLKPVISNMADNNNQLQVDRKVSDHTNKTTLQREITKLQEHILSIEKNIAAITQKYEEQMTTLSEEKDYTLFFYIATVGVVLNLVFKFNIPGLLIALIFAAIFYTYKKYFDKTIRAARITAEMNEEKRELETQILTRKKEIEEVEKQITS